MENSILFFYFIFETFPKCCHLGINLRIQIPSPSFEYYKIDMDQNAALHTSILAGFILIILIKLDLKTFGLVTCMLIEHRELKAH